MKPIKYLSKSEGLLYLKDVGVNIPVTYIGIENLTSYLEEELNQYIKEDSSWIIRFDASSEIRFLLEGGKVHGSNLIENIKHIIQLNEPYKGRFSMILQYCLNSSIEGVAKLLTDGRILIETERNKNSHFIRDGGIPYRYIVGPSNYQVQHPKLTSRNIEDIHSELIKVGKDFVVEWIITTNDEVFFTDAKRVPISFLGNIENSQIIIVKEGIARGVINDVSITNNKMEEPHILYIRKTSIEYLPFINDYTQGIIFENGGLLSHCIVYQSTKNIPIILGVSLDMVHDIKRQEVYMELDIINNKYIINTSVKETSG